MLTDYSAASTLSNLFESQATTYLKATYGGVVDLSGNFMTEILSTASLQPGPAIYLWTLNMNNGLLSVTYTDPVSPYFSFYGLKIQNSHTNATYTTLITSTSTVNQTDTTSTTFSTFIHNSDLSLIKYGQMGGSTYGTFLSVPYGITFGLAANTFVPNLKSVETRTNFALQLRTVIVDVTPPICLFFDLNMGTEQLILSFDEPVLAETLDFTGLTLISSVTGLGITFVTSPLSIVLVNTTQLVMNISISDMNKIKIATYGLESVSTVHPLNELLIQSRSVSDYFG